MPRKKNPPQRTTPRSKSQERLPDNSQPELQDLIDEGLLGPEDYFVIGGTADA
jgi:hypothetical protein